MSEKTTSAGPETLEAVDELLRQLVDARFVLTDRDGSVTRWSRPAEELFGWPGARMLGRPLLETLAVPDKAPAEGGQFHAVAHRKDGSELEIALTMVPVRMSQSLEFNGFLEALEIAAPHGSALTRLQQSHRAVVDWIAEAMAGEARLQKGELTAGTIVAFRPLVEPPAPADADDGGADPVMDPAAVAAAGQIADAMEAALGRSDDLERAIQGTTVGVEHAHREAAAARGEAAAAAGRIAELEELSGRLGSELGDARRLLEEMGEQVERLRTELRESRSASEEAARAEQERTGRTVDETRNLVESLRAELAGMPQAHARLGSELEDARSKLAALEGELADGRTERLETELEQTHAKLAALEDMHSRVAGLEGALADERARAVEAARLESELDEVRSRVHGVEEAAATQTGLRRELDETRARMQALNDRIDDGQVAAVGDEEARLLIADLREEMSALRARAAETSGVDDTELRQLVQEVRAVAAVAADRAARAGSAVAAAEQLTARAGEAAGAAESASSRACDAAGMAETRATRAEEAASAAESSSSSATDAAGGLRSQAATSEDAVSVVKAAVARAEEAAASLERANETAAAVEAAAARATEAACNADRHAERAEEHSREAEVHACSLAEAGAAVEPQAKRAEDAAAAAERSAGSAWNAARAAGEGGTAAAGAAPADRLRTNGNGHSGEHADPHRPLFGRKPLDQPVREPRAGFDDSLNPMATIALDGHFRDLNPPFTELVGYAEHEFRAAVWPPVVDRPNRPKHREEMRRMLAGETHSTEVNTGYVHAQGLLVPVVGRLSLVRENDEPSHFLLEVEAP